MDRRNFFAGAASAVAIAALPLAPTLASGSAAAARPYVIGEITYFPMFSELHLPIGPSPVEIISRRVHPDGKLEIRLRSPLDG